MEISDILHKETEAIRMRLEKMGIIIVDETCYGFELYYRDGKVIVITGYIPEKAAIFTVTVCTWTRMDFSISGQLKAKNEIIDDENKKPHYDFYNRYIKIKEQQFGDYLVNTDWLKNSDLLINYSVDNLDDSSRENLIEMGILFFSEFLAEYGNEFEKKFTKKIDLNIIPLESDQCAEMRSEKGMDETLKHFEGIILEKFPKGFYPN